MSHGGENAGLPKHTAEQQQRYQGCQTPHQQGQGQPPPRKAGMGRGGRVIAMNNFFFPCYLSYLRYL